MNVYSVYSEKDNSISDVGEDEEIYRCVDARHKTQRTGRKQNKDRKQLAQIRDRFTTIYK